MTNLTLFRADGEDGKGTGVGFTFARMQQLDGPYAILDVTKDGPAARSGKITKVKVALTLFEDANVPCLACKRHSKHVTKEHWTGRLAARR